MEMILTSVLAFVFAIGILVAVHEWGHYIVARMVGVKVLRFSIGFGRRIWTHKAGLDQTEYCISAIPLGGYVKLLDEREARVDPSDLQRAFNRQSIVNRIAILVAGPLMNFVFAVAAFWLMFLVGIPGLAPIVGQVEENSIAAHAGVVSQDRIVAVNGEPVATWEGAILDLLDAILAEERIMLELASESRGSHVTYLDVDGRIGELTAPGGLLSGIGMAPWSPTLAPLIGDIIPGGSAAEADLRPGDLIVSADGENVASWTAWVAYVQQRPGQTIDVVIKRQQEMIVLPLAIGVTDNATGEVIGRIGAGVKVPEDLYAGYRAEQRYTGIAALSNAVKRTWSMSVLTVRMVVRMVTGEVSVKNISGPINIAKYAGYSAKLGISSFLSFLAVVSLSLGILNLLPVPVLDGGQVVYQLLEAIKGQPLSERAQILGQQIGIAFLILVMSFAFYNDLNWVFS